MSLLELSIQQAGEKLRAGSLTSVQLVEAHLERISLADPVYGAFVEVTGERAWAAANQADRDFDRGLDRGPFQGIPVAFKDIIDIEGIPTTCGSRQRAKDVPAEDAEVVRRLLQGGAVLLGKLATYEFALVGPSFDQLLTPATNPWSPDHITGGSSSGSAAAVAGGMVRIAIGSDTGGSLRSPAGYCGVVALKPTFGRVPRHGVHPLSPSLDHVGPISATVAEAAITLDAIADDRDGGGSQTTGGSATALLGQDLKGLRIAYARDWFAHDPALQPEVLSAMDDAVSQLSLLGARIEEVELPDYPLMEAIGAVILHAEAMEIHRAALREEGALYGRQAYQSLAAGVCLTEIDLAQARHAARTVRDELDANIFARHDALVTANTLTTAPPFSACPRDRPMWTAMRTLPFNVTGHPALALPIGFARGLPIGMQIIGKAFNEAQICRIGAAFEASTDHSAQQPPPIRPVQVPA